MAIALTCECGARLEVDDTFAGQTISCPDCARPLKAPPEAQQIGRRTSGFALASFVLALVGAFTVVGTVVAIALGVVALRQISRHRDRVTGGAYAVSGIALGFVLTALSIFAYSNAELFGVGRLLVEANWAGKLDFPGALEVRRQDFSIERPSKAWGVHKDEWTPTQPWGANQHLDHMLLVNPSEDAHVVCFVIRAIDGGDWERQTRDEFARYNRVENHGRQNPKSQPARLEVKHTERPPAVNGVDKVEMLIDRTHAGQDRRFLMRIMKGRGDVKIYVVAAGSRRSHFERLEPQLRQALDSFRILDPVRRDWP